MKTPVLPPAPGRAALLWTLTFLVTLGTLLLAAALLLERQSRLWGGLLEASITVEVAAGAPEGAPPQAERVAAAEAALDALPGVAARALTPEEMADLVSPWLGDAAPLGDLPLPGLIDVRPAERGLRLPATEELATVLRDVPGVGIDDHGAWRGQVGTLVGRVRVLAAALLAGVALTVLAAVAAGTGARLAMSAEAVALLHTLGASDGAIAGRVAAESLRTALLASLFGTAIALVPLLAVSDALGVRGSAAPALARLDPADAPWLLVLPLATVLLSVAAARFTALRRLATLP